VTSLFSTVTTFVASHPIFAYSTVFLLAWSESVPIVGAITPGSAVIIAIGALAPSGAIRLWPLLVAAAAGAISGHALSSWIGRLLPRAALARWPLNRSPGLIARSEAFFSRYGGKSVFLARFTPGVRAFIPLLAGVFRIPASRFHAANVLSAFVLAPSLVLPGVLFGVAIEMLGAAAKTLALLLVVLAVAAWGIFHAARFARRRVVPLALAAVTLRPWADAGGRWSSRFLLGLLPPSRSEAGEMAVLAAVLAGAAWLFFGVLEDVVSGDPLVLVDTAFYRVLQDLRTPPGDAGMIAITELGDSAVVIPVTISVFLWLAWKRARRTALYWLGAIAGASLLNTIIKVALHRPRPGEPLYSGWSAFSFPSGHSTVNLVLYAASSLSSSAAGCIPHGAFGSHSALRPWCS
jgi:undecaprenyl-diphosphatase